MRNFMEKHWKKTLLVVLIVVLLALSYGIINLLLDKQETEQTIVDNVQIIEEQLVAEEKTDDELKNDDLSVEEESEPEEVTENSYNVSSSEPEVIIDNEEGESENKSIIVTTKDEEKSETKVDLEQDSDDDGAEDYIEDYFGTDKTKSDTDGDGLSDFIELYSLVLEPLSTDTNENGVLDGDEDLDGDGLTNIEESVIGTNIIYVDTDGDGLSDYDEDMVHNTNPTKEDTDDDGVSDAKEIEMGTDSSVFEETFYTVVKADEEDTVKVSVETTLSGEQVESLTVERYESEFLFPTTMPGYIGGAYDFSVDGEIGTATIKFEFDEALLTDATFDPVIYYFDEENQVLEELDTIVSGNVAAAEVTHFSKYILLNRKIYRDAFEWQDVWNTIGYSEMEVVFVIDLFPSVQTDAIRSTACNLVDILPDDCKLCVVNYVGTINIYYEWRTDKAKIKQILKYGNNMSDSDVVSTDGAVNAAINQFDTTATNVLKKVILLTDDQASYIYYYPEIIKTANSNNINIYTIWFGDNESKFFLDYLEPLANETGGKPYIMSNDKQVGQLCEEFYKEFTVELDSDEDGVPDYYEDNLRMFNGVTLKLDKYNPDTDGDGLLDGEEVGKLIYQYNENSTKVLVTAQLSSNPLDKDTDIDEISDEEEVIIGTNRFHVDTDNDGMLDGEEYVEGFDPLEADADGDGRYDWREYAEGTDPYVYNKEWNEYAWEFICGVVAGDFIADSDSFATTAGQILGSFIPGIDIRDVIGNCVHGDYMMATVSFGSLIPVGGDMTKALAKTGKYVVKNTDNVPEIAELLAFLNKHCPDIAKALGKSDDFIDIAKQLSKADNLKLTRKQRKVLMETFENAGLSQYLLKTENLDGLKDAVNVGEDVWENGACKRGRIIDEFINEHLLGKGLGTNFPVADRVVDRTLVSTKSLDIAAQSYQNPSRVRSMLNKYLNDLNGFERKYFKGNDKLEWGGKELKLSEYDKKALEIVLPDTMITENILKELNTFKETMDKAGIEIWYRITKSK